MKKYTTILILLSLLACKKEEIKPQTQIPVTQSKYTFEAKGLSAKPFASQIALTKKGSFIWDSIWYGNFHPITINTGDTVMINDNDFSLHNIKIYIDNKIFMDTIVNQVNFNYKYIAK